MITRRSILVGVAGLPFSAVLLTSESRAQSITPQFDFYISPNGSDSNAGTSTTQAWALTSLKDGSLNYSRIAGAKIGLLDGTYDISTWAQGSLGTKLELPAGTSSSPTVIQAVNARAATIVSDPGAAGYSPGDIIGNLSIGSDHPAYITIDGLVIRGGVTPPANTGVSGVAFAGPATETCPGLVIQNCEIYNILNPNGAANIGCVWFGTGPTGAIVRNCKLHDCYTVGIARDGHSNSSGVHDYSNLVTVEYCTIYGCNNGVYQKNQKVTPPPDGMTIRYCYFYAGEGMGPALAGFNNAFGTTPPYRPLRVHNNIFENIGMFYECNDGAGGLQANVYFYNNVVCHQVGTATLGEWAPTAAAYSAGVKIAMYNNILAGSGPDRTFGAITLGPSGSAWTPCDYNCYPPGPRFGLVPDMGVDPTSLMGLSAWQGQAGSPDMYSLTGDPGFVGPMVAGGGPMQYQLSGSSICKSAGREGGASSGAPVDMGAWAGAVSVGCNFGPVPSSPSLLGVT